MTDTTRRRGNWKQLHSGRPFWVLDPDPEDITIEDIAHALACTNRYGGHCPEPYSVAQHSIMVSDLARDAFPDAPTRRNAALCGLLHDAAEAYVGDMVAPLKREMPAFEVAEERVMAAIRLRFNLSSDPIIWAEVKNADAIALATEARDFFPVRPMDWNLKAKPKGPHIRPWDWRKARAEFLARFNQLSLGQPIEHRMLPGWEG